MMTSHPDLTHEFALTLISSPFKSQGHVTCHLASAFLSSLSAVCPVATFWLCTQVRGVEIVSAKKTERGVRTKKEKRLGNKGRHADAGSISFTICKYCCLCDMQMRDYRALIRVKRTVHVN